MNVEKHGNLHAFPPEAFADSENFGNRRGNCVDSALAILSGISPRTWTKTIMSHPRFEGEAGTEWSILADLIREFFGGVCVTSFYHGDWHTNRPTMKQMVDSGLSDGVYMLIAQTHAAALEVRDGVWYIADNNNSVPKVWKRTTHVYKRSQYSFVTGELYERTQRKHSYPVFGARARIRQVWRIPT